MCSCFILCVCSFRKFFLCLQLKWRKLKIVHENNLWSDFIRTDQISMIRIYISVYTFALLLYNIYVLFMNAIKKLLQHNIQSNWVSELPELFWMCRKKTIKYSISIYYFWCFITLHHIFLLVASYTLFQSVYSFHLGTEWHENT